MPRIVHHLLAVVFAVACICWIFHEPYVPSRVVRPLPAGVTLVTEHGGLSARLPEMVRNPVVVSTLLAAGMDEKDLDEIAEDPQFKRWLNQLVGRRTMFAYTPSMGPDAEPAWMLTSWVGGAGYRLRALLSIVPVDGFSKAYRHNGRQVWRIDTGGEAEDPQLTATITEGVLIAAYSRDPLALQDLLDCHDGFMAGVGRFPESPYGRLSAWADEAPDRGYAFLPFPSAMMFRIDTFSAQRIHGDVSSRGLPTDVLSLNAEGRAGEWPRLLGNIPLATMSLPPDMISHICMYRTDSEFPQILGTLLNNVDSDLASLALLGGDFRGTLQNIRIPTFLLALRVPDRTQATQLAEGLMHQSNAFKKLGLIATPVEAAHPLFALESTTRQPYNQFPREDLVAYAQIGELLVICSNFGVLKQLVDRYDTKVAAFEAGQGEWLNEFKDRPHQGQLWMNATRSGKAVKETLTAWSLSLLFESDTEDRTQIKQIDEMKLWVDRLMPLETVRAWHHLDGDQNYIRIELGPK